MSQSVSLITKTNRKPRVLPQWMKHKKKCKHENKHQSKIKDIDDGCCVCCEDEFTEELTYKCEFHDLEYRNICVNCIEKCDFCSKIGCSKCVRDCETNSKHVIFKACMYCSSSLFN